MQLYAYAKVAQGEDINAAAKPGMMDFTVSDTFSFSSSRLAMWILYTL